MKNIKWNSEMLLKVTFFLLLLIGLTIWMVLQPFGSTPDEEMRYSICKYIFEHGKLPTGGDPEILNHTWGFSYAFQPILPYMISAVFMKVAVNFCVENFFALLSARFVNVLCGMIMAFFVCRIGEKIFKSKTTKWLFILLVTLLPQAMFIHTYVNTDSMALMSTAIMFYAWIIGMETEWNTKSCILLSVGISLCALSYYNAYGFILSSILLFAGSFWKWTDGKITFNWKAMLTKGAFISILVFVMIGWWFIRSYFLYDGDFLGLTTRNEYAEIYAREDLKPSLHATYLKEGYSLLYMLLHSNFIRLTTRSFIAMFGNMSLGVYNWIYRVYYVLIVFGVLGFFYPAKRRDYFATMEKGRLHLLHICLGISLIIPNFLNMWAAYSYDYQPQGRYSLPMLLPLMYFITVGIHKLLTATIRNQRVVQLIEMAAGIFVITAAVLSLTDFILPAYYNTFMEWFKNTFLMMAKS